MASPLLEVEGHPLAQTSFRFAVANEALKRSRPVKRHHLLIIIAAVIVLVGSASSASAQVSSDSSELTPLNNKDVLVMVEHQLQPEAIVQTIKVSACTFDTFPPILKEMKRRGVPDTVLQAMVEAPYGPSLRSSSQDDLGEQPIYHYTEQLKQLGFVIPTTSRRGSQPYRQTRARASKPRQRS